MNAIDHVVVMAASPSRGMESLTRTRPKAMLPILGKPMIGWALEDFYQAGIRNFTIVVGEHEGTVVEWLTTRWHQDVNLTFAPQGHQRGTASTLFAARSLIDRPFIITPCDFLVSKDHIAQLASYFVYHGSDAAALSLFYTPDEATSTASVLLDPRGNVAYISEQSVGAHQDYMTVNPLYALMPDILAYLDKVPVMEDSGERVLASAVQMMIDDGRLVGAVQAEFRTRLDTPEDLLAVNLRLLQEPDAHKVEGEVPSLVEIISPVHIERGVSLGQGATIGPNVYLETGTVIGANSRIENSVILGRTISPDSQIAHELVSGDR